MDARVYDGQTLKQAFKSGEDLLEQRIDEINNLNVFPVPDGDTGINMFLTLQSANQAIKDTTSKSASEVAAQAANGALLGARGNSGVIFSQILLGLARGLANKDQFTAIDFAQALLNASENAYKALLEPVEGTILTVIRESAEKAMQKAREGANLQQTIAALTSQAKDTVTRTPEMLPVLKEAGVVDAGGKGLFYFFQGMKNFMVKKMNPYEGYKAVRRRTAKAQVEICYGYDLQFLIEGENMPVDEIRTWVCTMGESVLVVGDESLIRVHVHTKNSQVVMGYCSEYGALKDIINDNMDDQVTAFHQRKDLEYNPDESVFLTDDDEPEDTELSDSAVRP